jgi:ABC-type uncharacterized transport system permease subunit
MNVLAIIGFIITVVGFFITIRQIYKTQKISNAAYLAASEAKSAIKSTIIISDLSTIIKSFQEIKDNIRNGKFDASYLRTNDLIHSLIQTKQLILGIECNEQEIIKKMITQLSVLRNQLEAAIYKNEKIDALKINQRISELEIDISELATKIKFPPTGGNK